MNDTQKIIVLALIGFLFVGIFFYAISRVHVNSPVVQEPTSTPVASRSSSTASQNSTHEASTTDLPRIATSSGPTDVGMEDTTLPAASNTPVFCTQDAKQCPDGSYVGRIQPNCDFAACPGAQ